MLPTPFRRPHAELSWPLGRDVGRLFDDFLHWRSNGGAEVETALNPVDIREKNGSILVDAEVPGFDKREANPSPPKPLTPARVKSNFLSVNFFSVMCSSATRRLLRGAMIMLVLLAVARPAAAVLMTGSEDVSGSIGTPQYTHEGKTYGPYGWGYSYTRSFDGEKLVKHLEIDFVFEPALNWIDEQQVAYKAAVEAGIEGIWNNRYSIKDENTGKTYPVSVDMTTEGPFNQTVTVHAGEGRADMLNWFETDTASINAHEFGHMLGLFDEYIGGAVDQYPNPTLSDDGLMGLGALNPNPVMHERYYQQYLDYMNQLNEGGQFSLVAVPEASNYALLAMGLVCLAARRRIRWRQPA